MKPATPGHIKGMKELKHMTDIELWRDTMCGQIKSDLDYCYTPDGTIRYDDHACAGICRYSNRKAKP